MATPIDDDTLQRFYDGELSALEAHGVQSRLENDPAAQRRLVQLGQLTELMREGAHLLEKQVDSEALFAAIEGKLAAPSQVGVGQRWRLIASEWVEHRRATLIPLVTASAVAAATLLLVLRPAEYGGRVGEPPIVDTARPSAPVAAIPAVHGSTVENVDFGASTGTVFAIEDQGVALAVVWITDEEETP